MNTISKDQSIITQVAAKIAADLTPKTDDLQTNVGNWVVAFDVTLEALLDKHGKLLRSLNKCSRTLLS